MSWIELAEHPAFRGNLGPVPDELTDVELPVISGALPVGLEGILMRIGPNPRFAPPLPAQHHWFLGDGMVHGVTLSNGRAFYRNRWVRTAKWRAEDEAGRGLYAGWGYRPIEGAPKIRLDGTANTNLIEHAGRLFALQESFAPFEMSASDLATLAPETFGDGVSAFTAHPKADPVTGDLYGYGVQTAGFASTQARYYVLGADGGVKRSDVFDLPFPAYVHDFLVSERHVVFPLSPLIADRETAQKGQPYTWRGDRSALIGVFDREAGPADIRWIEAPAFYVFHVFNAYDAADGRIVCDVVEYSRPPLFPDETGRVPGTDEISSAIVRWTIDPTSTPVGFERRHVCASPAFSLEFPIIDERATGRRHRIGYFVGREDGDKIGFNTLARVDFESGDVQSRRYGPEDMLSEALFIPRRKDAPLDDGYLAFFLYRADEDRSELHLLDAADLNGEPVTVLGLPRRLPQGFHGLWLGVAA
jgi:carotenoid cleavage dioxygenase-like enzyme